MIESIDSASPAERAGLYPGLCLVSADGQPLHDVIDWYWLADGQEVEVTAQSEAGRTKVFRLQREFGEDWGITFADPLFDGLKTCANACRFCFIEMLPLGLRPGLYLRDDDFRLSFLSGNFVTLSNLSEADLQRIVGQRLSPLHVSLHAVSPAVRAELIGRQAARGLEALERLLAAGIEFHAQIVLVPGVNDGAELERTLAWVLAHPGVLSVGVVPYAYTGLAKLQTGYSGAQAARLIAGLGGLAPRVQLADEWFVLAGAQLPEAAYYGGFWQYEDGIGMLRTWLDDWDLARAGLADGADGAPGRADTGQPGSAGAAQVASAEPLPLDAGQAASAEPLPIDTGRADTGQPGSAEPPTIVTGQAFADYLKGCLADSPWAGRVRVQALANDFFGGCLNVAGLLTGKDLIDQIEDGRGPILVPEVIFNDDGLTLDGYRASELANCLSRAVHVIPCKAEALVQALLRFSPLQGAISPGSAT